jgi:hypothetical protein
MEAPDLVDQLIGAVQDFATGALRSDDMTAMVVRYRRPVSPL